MDLCLEKKDDCWLWWAIDRASKCVLGWALGDRGTETAERLDAQLPHAPHIVFATDFWHPYGKIFGGENHVQGKAHTYTIESLNNRIRCYLARLKRKTHNYSKSQVNLAASILFFIVKKCGGELVSELKPIPI
jgi:insertion element IS1 protein InsB